MKYFRHKITSMTFIYVPFESSYLCLENSKTFFFPKEELEEITFHEAFRDHVNRIVLDAITDQHKEVIRDLQKENNELNHEVAKWKNSSKFEYDDYKYSRDRLQELFNENKLLKQHIMELTQKNIDQQREFDQRFCDLYDSQKPLKDNIEKSTAYIGELKKFIQHLQDYIAAKHLGENGLILEKFIQEGNDGR